MKNLLFLFAFLFSLSTFAQKTRIFGQDNSTRYVMFDSLEEGNLLGFGCMLTERGSSCITPNQVVFSKDIQSINLGSGLIRKDTVSWYVMELYGYSLITKKSGVGSFIEYYYNKEKYDALIGTDKETLVRQCISHIRYNEKGEFSIDDTATWEETKKII